MGLYAFISPFGVVKGLFELFLLEVGYPPSYMRIRHTSNDSARNYPFAGVTVDYPSGSSASFSGSVDGFEINAQGKYIADVVTPRFAKRSAAGEIIINPMTTIVSERTGSPVALTSMVFHTDYSPSGSSVVQAITSGECDVYSLSGKSGALYSDLALSNPTELVTILESYEYSSVSALESALLAQCISKAVSDGPLALVTAAELPKTAELIQLMLGKLQSLLRVIKHHQKDEAVFSAFAKMTFAEIKLMAKYAKTTGPGGRKFVKNLRLTPLGLRRLATLCGLWLGYRYGIMATYYDVMSWSKSLKSGKVRTRLTSSSATNYTDTIHGFDDSNPFYDMSVDQVKTRSTVSTAGCLLAPGFEGFPNSKGAARALSTAWELMPLSFVLDWAWDVSTRLAALEASFLCPVVGTWIIHRSTLVENTTFVQTPKTSTVGSPPTETRYGVGSRGAQSIQVSKIVERKANPAVSYVPESRINLNWKRIADGLALSVVLRATFKDLMKSVKL